MLGSSASSAVRLGSTSALSLVGYFTEAKLTKYLTAGLIGVDSVNYWKGELSFGEVFGKTFVGCILDYC